MENIAQYLIRSAELYPDKIAVNMGREQISYSELNLKSNRLANYLLGAGLDPGDRVGIYLSKSVEALIAIYGVMKARGVYVPVDPLAPVSRVEYILQNCSVRFLITKYDRLIHLHQAIENKKLDLDAILLCDESAIETRMTCSVATPKELEDQDDRLPREIINRYGRHDNAYILYTSGSTGRPKGVTLTHANGMCYVEWAAKEMELAATDVFSNHAPFQFDLTIFDLFVAARVGGRLVLIPDKVKAMGRLLIKYILTQKITVWYSVPLALIKMIKAENFAQIRKSELRTIIFAGEVFHIKYFRQLYETLPSVSYYNLYGPTESNVCTYYKVKPTDLENDHRHCLPIGRPCDYAILFTINPAGEALDLAQGGQGELCIAGESVMSGYWNDREKSKKAFLPIPSQFEIDGMAYRSGDIVRQDDEGNYVYVARKDRMVKCKGYRIELNEIETVIGQIEFVKEVAVVAVKQNEYEDKIIAFLSPHQKRINNAKEVLQFCRQKLPNYMIPESIIVLEEMPRTLTEKIDYTSLKTTFFTAHLTKHQKSLTHTALS